MVFTRNPSASPVAATIAIIGGGFCGAMVAAHLLKTTARSLTIKLIEGRPTLARGVAYSTQAPSHLLNVPAANMSAFADDPGHLLRWLSQHRHELASLLPDPLTANPFIPRQVYGRYLQSVLEDARAKAAQTVHLEHVQDEAIALEPAGEGALITLRCGGQCFADKVVLAIGNTPATPFAGDTTEWRDRPIRNAWSADALADLDQTAPVLLVGTGLTMVDMLLSLGDRHHQGPIYALSRRGLVPQCHQASTTYPLFLATTTAPKTTLGLWRRVRAEIAAARHQNIDWRAVIDSLRPITQPLWQGLPLPEQQRFLRHAMPYWDVHRHRIAPSIGDRISHMQRSQQLQITAGRIQGYQRHPNGVAVTVRLRHSQAHRVLAVQRVINGTGIATDYQRSPQPLIAHLQSQGLIRPNPLGLGLDTAPNGAILDAQGIASSTLYTLGTPRKGDLWETIAVPELRCQAQALAQELLHTLPTHVRPVSALARSPHPLDEHCLRA